MLVFNFTGIYEKEGLTDLGTLIDLRDLTGTGMYIDAGSESEIKERLFRGGYHKGHMLRFLDNGNYHYMTRVLASFIGEPFDLITFDHHTDDQLPAFFGFRSCGSWRYDIRQENKYLNRSMLIQRYEDFRSSYEASDLPLYISIDKDVLSADELNTNWDQGDMSVEELTDILRELFAARDILAVDVCGEDLEDRPYEANKAFNLSIVRLCNASFGE